jgi:hypothetical protein
MPAGSGRPNAPVMTGRTEIWLGSYSALIAVAIVSRKAAAAEENPKARWGIWVLPWLLSLDNITFGVVDGVSSGSSVWASAGEQALSSALQAGVGLAIGIGIVYLIPALRRRMWLANATAGGAMLVAAGVLYLVG